MSIYIYIYIYTYKNLDDKDKPCWDDMYLHRLNQATNPANNSDIAAVVMHEGLAHVCLLTSCMTGNHDNYCIYIYIYIYMYDYNNNKYAFIHKLISSLRHLYAHIRIYTHTYIHTYIHACIHTCIQLIKCTVTRSRIERRMPRKKVGESAYNKARLVSNMYLCLYVWMHI